MIAISDSHGQQAKGGNMVARRRKVKGIGYSVWFWWKGIKTEGQIRGVVVAGWVPKATVIADLEEKKMLPPILSTTNDYLQ